MRSWEGEDDLDRVELAAPAVPRRPRAAGEELWAARYPRPQQHTAPPGLKGRARRAWLREARRDDRRQRHTTAAGWRRNRPPEQAAGLGVLVLVLALAAAVVVFWPREEPARTPARPATSAAPAPVSTSPPTMAPRPAVEDGHDHTGPPETPPAMRTPAGETAYRFLLGYLTYSPAYGDPLGNWVTGWGRHATGELTATAAQQSTLFDFTVARSVHVSSPRVLSVAVDGDTFTLHGTWDLFPIGGDETSMLVTEEIDVVLTVTGGRVSAVTVTPPGRG